MIVQTPETCNGLPRIDGTRMTVRFLVELREANWSNEDILRSYPHLTNAQLEEVWAYADVA